MGRSLKSVPFIPVSNRFTESLFRPGFTAWVLLPCTALYWLGWRSYEAIYRLGLKHPQRAHPAVICVGNLVVGGSGKTPFTRWLAEQLTARGYSVVLSLSGYGSPRSVAATLAPEGELDPAEWGDEPALMRSYLPSVPMVVGRRRVLAAQIAAERFPGSVLLLDDGYQHLPLQKDFALILDVGTPVRYCLPSGPYRQPARDIIRADVDVHRQMDPARVQTLSRRDGSRVSTDWLAGRSISLLVAVAQPFWVQYAIEELGARMTYGQFLDDHDPLTAPTLLKDVPRDRPLVVTAKDWVKLRRRTDLAGIEVMIFDYEYEFPENLVENLVTRLDNELAARGVQPVG